MDNKIVQAAFYGLIYITFFTFSLILAPPLCQAEFYKYYDQNGVLRYTDDLSEVPPKQRMQVKTYLGYQSQESKPEASQEKTETAAKSLDKQELSVSQKNEEALWQKKAELDEAFQALNKEKKQLEDSRKAPKKATTKKQYEKQIKAFNAKVKAYEEKRKAYLADLTAARSESVMP
jgi:hypothetical protein